MTAFPRRRGAPQGAHAAWASRGDDPFAGEALTSGAATEAIARMAPQERPLGSLVEVPPPAARAPRPTFTPAASGPQTRADLVIAADDPCPLSRAVRVWLTVRPVIGDSLGRLPEPEGKPPAWAGPGATAMLYSGPGWTRVLEAVRLRNGELEELPALVEQGLGRNAAEAATAARHFRERVVEAAAQFCAGIGLPSYAGTLLQRVHELNVAAQRRGARDDG